jgi:hypothetical protein
MELVLCAQTPFHTFPDNVASKTGEVLFIPSGLRCLNRTRTTQAEKCLSSSPSTGVSLKKVVNTMRFLADIRVPKENHHTFGDKQAKSTIPITFSKQNNL